MSVVPRPSREVSFQDNQEGGLVMIMRIMKALFVSICLFVFSSGFETVAFADGGGGGGGEGLTAPKDKPAKTGAAAKSKTDKEKAVRGSLRAIELTPGSLKRWAKRDNPRGIKSRNRLFPKLPKEVPRF